MAWYIHREKLTVSSVQWARCLKSGYWKMMKGKKMNGKLDAAMLEQVLTAVEQAEHKTNELATLVMVDWVVLGHWLQARGLLPQPDKVEKLYKILNQLTSQLGSGTSPQPGEE